MSADSQQYSLALRATKRVLVPLFRALVRLGVTLPSLLPVIKASYTAAAQEILAKEKRKETVSQLNLMTGVHRKDLKAILEEEGEELPDVTGKVPLWSAVLTEWRYNPRYRDDEDQPAALEREASPGADKPGFFELVKLLSKDLHPGAVLKELVARNLVEELDGGRRLKLIVEDDLGAQSPISQFQSLSFIAGSNLETGVSNAFKERDEPEFQKAIFYDRMSDQSRRALKKLAEQRANEVLQELNQKANELAIQDRLQDDKSCMILFGTFLRTEEQSDEE